MARSEHDLFLHEKQGLFEFLWLLLRFERQ